MAVDDDDKIIMLGNSSGNPRPLTDADPLPAALAEKINAAALATVNALVAKSDALAAELEGVRGQLGEAARTIEDQRADIRRLQDELARRSARDIAEAQ